MSVIKLDVDMEGCGGVYPRTTAKGSLYASHFLISFAHCGVGGGGKVKNVVESSGCTRP